MSIPTTLTDPQPSAAYRFVVYGMRLYVLCLLGATAYTVAWFTGTVSLSDETILAGVWVLITAMGASFLFLVPIFYRRRLSLF